MAINSRIQSLNVGVTDIARWRLEDEAHLPETSFRPAPFLPRPQPLDQILRRETLDERLKAHVTPRHLDPDLMLPATLARTRQGLRDRMLKMAASVGPAQAAALFAAADLLDEESALDDEVQQALSLLLRA